MCHYFLLTGSIHYRPEEGAEQEVNLHNFFSKNEDTINKPLSNNMKIIAELGRLYRYESRSDSLRHLRFRRTSDLLVWNSADKTRKTK
jgi:hypothetical protein